MNTGMAVSVAQWWATDAPVLPSPWALAWGLRLGWSVVLAWLGFWLAGRFRVGGTVQLGIALLLAVWTWMPGPYALAYWLGLAFQLPSISLVVLSGVLLARSLLHAQASPKAYVPEPRTSPVWIVSGVLLGWVLLLDTLAVFPLSLYVWGWSPMAVSLVALCAGMPWLLQVRKVSVALEAWVLVVVVGLFVVTRLPTGNLWDALLDPCLWVVLHVLLVRHLVNCYRKRS